LFDVRLSSQDLDQKIVSVKKDKTEAPVFDLTKYASFNKKGFCNVQKPLICVLALF